MGYTYFSLPSKRQFEPPHPFLRENGCYPQEKQIEGSLNFFVLIEENVM